MARIDSEKKLKASILNRLIDNDPNNAFDTDSDQHQKLEALRSSVRFDLENLLNTRLKIAEPDDEFSELKTSLLNYGLPDLATVNISDITKKKAFIKQLESLLTGFEPRFKSVSVTYRENSDKLDRTLRFRIDATLYADPSPEIVVFDSILEPISRTLSLTESSHA